MITRFLCLLVSVSSLSAANSGLDKLFNAIHQVETGGRTGAILGDNGRALGPLQIHKGYWLDSRVPGVYSSCTNLAYSQSVMLAYWKRYAPKALAANDLETLARIHNGGPLGYKKSATLGYWRKVKTHLDK
jgi:hypothetical protein